MRLISLYSAWQVVHIQQILANVNILMLIVIVDIIILVFWLRQCLCMYLGRKISAPFDVLLPNHVENLRSEGNSKFL